MTERTDLRSPRFDLHGTDPSRRAKAWSDALNQYFYSYETDYPGDFRNGEFQGVASDDLRVATIMSDPMHVERRASHIAKDATDAYFLVLPRGGDIMLRQRGNEAVIREGQFTFVSTTEPYSYRQDETESFHALLIPGPLVRARKPDADDHLCGDFSASGLQRVFSDFASSFCLHALEFDPEALKRTHDSLLDMLALVLEHTNVRSCETVVGMAHRRRVLRAVEQQFRGPGTSIGSIAAALGLSPRYIQQILAEHGETVSGLVRDRRVLQARRLLERRGASQAPVATVAYACGFTDPAFFSRVFKRHTGMSPLEYAERDGCLLARRKRT